MTVREQRLRTTAACGNNTARAGHRFDQREGKSLRVGAQHVQIQRSQHPSYIAAQAEKAHSVGKIETVTQLLQLWKHLARGVAGDHEANLRVLSANNLRTPQQRLVPLSASDVAHRPYQERVVRYPQLGTDASVARGCQKGRIDTILDDCCLALRQLEPALQVRLQRLRHEYDAPGAFCEDPTFRRSEALVRGDVGLTMQNGYDGHACQQPGQTSVHARTEQVRDDYADIPATNQLQQPPQVAHTERALRRDNLHRQTTPARLVRKPAAVAADRELVTQPVHLQT